MIDPVDYRAGVRCSRLLLIVGICATVGAISSFSIVPAVLAVACFVLLWLNVRYWRNRIAEEMAKPTAAPGS